MHVHGVVLVESFYLRNTRESLVTEYTGEDLGEIRVGLSDLVERTFVLSYPFKDRRLVCAGLKLDDELIVKRGKDTNVRVRRGCCVKRHSEADRT